MIKIFCSYAHEDAQRLERLVRRQLGPLARQKRIKLWVDRSEIMAGQNWRSEIMSALDAADLILLLLTTEFFGSDFVANVELRRALQRRTRREATVVPILVGHATGSSLKVLLDRDIQIVPGPESPIYAPGATPESIDHAWVGVTEDIERVVDDLSGLGRFRDNVTGDMCAFLAELDEGVVEQCLVRPRRHEGGRWSLRSPRGTAGYRWRWQEGSVYWTPGGVHAVWGPLAAAYIASGGPPGHLGFPVSDQGDALDSTGLPVGRYQRFEGTADLSTNMPPGVPYGASLYLRTGDDVVRATTGRIGQAFESLAGTAGPLGFPRGAQATAVAPTGTTGDWQLFEGGALYASDAHGAWAVLGRLLDAYVRHGGPEGRFGFPTGQAVDDGRDLTQEFEGGVISVAHSGERETRGQSDQTAQPTVAAGSFREGHQELFAALPDGRIVHRWHYGAWSPWVEFDVRRPPVELTTLSNRAGIGESAWLRRAAPPSGSAGTETNGGRTGRASPHHGLSRPSPQVATPTAIRRSSSSWTTGPSTSGGSGAAVTGRAGQRSTRPPPSGKCAAAVLSREHSRCTCSTWTVGCGLARPTRARGGRTGWRCPAWTAWSPTPTAPAVTATASCSPHSRTGASCTAGTAGRDGANGATSDRPVLRWPV